MNKKIISVLFTFILCVLMSVPVFAVGTTDVTDVTDSTEVGFVEGYNRVQDYAEVLTADEYYRLNAVYDELRNRQKMDVIICFTNDIEGKTPSEYAETLFDECKYGYGADRDGVLLLVSFEDRDWYITTHGYGKTAFTSSGIQYIGDMITDDLASKNYVAATESFAQLCDSFITDARNGTPYGEETGAIDDGGFQMPPPLWIPISIGVGLIVALIVVLTMKGKLKSVRMQAAASNYLKDGSLNITDSSDIFLYSNVSRTARPKEGKDNDGGSSGGDFGGGGGKF